MRQGIHPDYHPVVYVDMGANHELVTRSTMTSEEVRTIDGVDHYVIRLEISSASHPFYTGKQHFVDTAGRIEKFRQRFGDRGGAGKFAGTSPAAAKGSESE